MSQLGDKSSSVPVVFDDVFHDINSFGTYQKTVYFSCCLLVLYLSFPFAMLVFGFATSRFECSTPNITCAQNKCCQNCTSYVYDDSFTSTVTEWNLICDRASLTAVVQSSMFAGMFFGAGVSGMVSDTFGRKKCIFIFTGIMMLGGFASSFANSAPLMAFLYFVMGFGIPGLISSLYVYLIEIVGPSYRTMAGSFDDICYSIGSLVFVLLAYYIRHWRILAIAITAPGVVLYPFWRFATLFLGNALFLYVSNLSGNIYLNFTIMVIIAGTQQPIMWFFLKRFGRRIPHAVLLFLIGLQCFLVLAVPDKYPMARSGLFLAATAMTGSLWNALYIRTTEIYPTVARNTAHGTGAMIGRIGGITAPFVAMLGRIPGFGLTVSVISFGVVSLAAGVISLFIPETLFAPMHQTIEEVEAATDDYGIPCWGRPARYKYVAQRSFLENNANL